MKIQKLFAVSFVSSLAFASFSQAGQVIVTNQNDKPITLTITAEGDSKEGTLATFTQDIAASQDTVFEVTKSALGDKEMFSLNGDTKNMFTPSSTCKNLKVSEHYAITFTNDKMGTTCHSKVLSDIQVKEIIKKNEEMKNGNMKAAKL